ncbi:MAG: hypothetical protein ACK59A_15195 [Cyanobacteriota bacterium]
MLHHHLPTSHPHTPHIILQQQGLPSLLAKGVSPDQHRREQFPLIPWRVGAVEQPIEVMAQLLGEHRHHLPWAGAPQPVGVEINRGGARGVGPDGGRHGIGGQQLHRRQILDVASAPAVHQPPQRFRLARQHEGLSGSLAEGSRARPLAQQLPPIMQQEFEVNLGHDVVSIHEY